MSKWIKCSERLPKDDVERVIGYDEDYKKVGECCWNYKNGRLVFVSGHLDDCDVTHWMPLPEPPNDK